DLILIPVLLSYVHIKRLEKYREKMSWREDIGEKAWRPLSKLSRPVPAAITIIVCIILVALGYWKQMDLTIGATHPGVPALRPDSLYNQDVRGIQDRFNISTNILKIMAESEKSAC